MSERNTYIENNPIEDALREYLSRIAPLESEEVATEDSVGRILARAVIAKVCDPSYNASAMDGICVVSDNTEKATLDNPQKLILHKDFEYVNTGNPISGKYDSVIMIEDVLVETDDVVYITAPAVQWQHVRVIGESVVASEMVLSSLSEVRPMDLSALIGSGNETVSVIKKPKLGIIPTGNEMVETVDKLGKGFLMESNSKVFSALAAECGALPKRYPIVLDDKEKLTEAIKKGTEENDVLIVNAGSSAGTKDYACGILKKLGTVVVHGLAIRPGKPTILALVNGKPVIGVPGYPVSAYMVFEKVVKPVIRRLRCAQEKSSSVVNAVLTKRIVSSFKCEEYVRVALGVVSDKIVASPLDRGAASVMSLVKADGIVTIPRMTEGYESGAVVSVELLKDMSTIRNSLVIVGSNDMIIDFIADKMPVSSAHVGSLLGIFALKNKAAHIAPIHLLDGESGTYNVKAALEHFAPGEVSLVKGVKRIQGILVPKGNPNGIRSVADIKNFSFANRQRGAGTRVLFDYLLDRSGISPDEIRGYDKEFGTHLSVATAVQSGVCDCGIAVLSAANIMNLDFIPIGAEEYDFLVYTDTLADERVKRFIEVLTSDRFRKEVTALGGYEFDRTGEVVKVE